MRRTSSSGCRDSRPGKVVAWVVLSLSVIIGMAALTLDGGRLLEERRRLQAAADAAGLAAAADLYANYWANRGKDPAGTARDAAVQCAAAYGLPASAVTVNVPPTAGAYAGQDGYVEVEVRTDLEATFGKLITSSDLTVRGRSVVRGQPMKIGLILMRASGADAFLNNSPAFTLVGTPLIVNSTDPAAFRQQSLGVFVASRSDLAGGYVNPGGALMLGRIRTNLRPVPDPLAFLPIPSGGAVRSAVPLTINSLLPVVLQPGVYQGGIQITGASAVVMSPGVYVMQGGGFRVSGSAAVTSLETMVYNTTSSDYAAGPISITTLGKVVVTAQLSGTYQGISFFQDRSLSNPVTMTGNALSALTGVVYAVKAPAQLTGLASVGVSVLGGAYVVDSMTVGGVGAINIDLKLNPPRIPDVRPVE